MYKDPIINEVRKNRKSLEEKWGNDFKSLHEHALEYQKQFKDRLVSKEELEKRETEIPK